MAKSAKDKISDCGEVASASFRAAETPDIDLVSPELRETLPVAFPDLSGGLCD
jgi:hypothetical protein